MKIILPIIGVALLVLGLLLFLSKKSPEERSLQAKQSQLNQPSMKKYKFLSAMRKGDFYPDWSVMKGCEILIDLCAAIEAKPPSDPSDLYKLTHAATREFNTLDSKMREQGAELETMARGVIATDFEAIASAYGFPEADRQELVAPRDW